MSFRFSGRRAAALCAVLVALAPGATSAQIVGENVNMVTGNKWPGGDPFLQRQNEPSIAMSSWTIEHLLAGANDYRSVDVPGDTYQKNITGDAWLGVFKSLDGGQTWKSYLLPGYPQDTATCGNANIPATAKAACGFEAGADPVVRAGTDGMFYYSGLVFTRDHARSRIVVGRYIDLNNRENGDATVAEDPIRHVDVVEVASGYTNADGSKVFVDKPWIAVDVPRNGATSCTIAVPATGTQPATTRTFAAGTIYVAWTRIQEDASGKDVSSDILVKRSTDCGKTWSAEVKVNDAAVSQNQGATMGIDPLTGKLYVVWRRIGSATTPDALLIARSFSKGAKFTRPRVVVSIPHTDVFDHGSNLKWQFKSLMLPTFAVSVGPDGASRHLHLAWAQYMNVDTTGAATTPSSGRFSRIVITTANVSPPPPTNQEIDETETTADHWSTPTLVDPAPMSDDAGGVFAPGHQFMPQLTASQGRVVVVFYDSRFDHSRGYLEPRTAGDGSFAPDPLGRFYREQRGPLCQRRLTSTAAPAAPPLASTSYKVACDDPAAVFNSKLDDRGDIDGIIEILKYHQPTDTTYSDAEVASLRKLILQETRHTVDVMVATALAGPSPVFSSVERLSRFPGGIRGDEAWFTDSAGNLSAPGYAPGGVDMNGIPIVQGGKVMRLQQLQASPVNLTMFKGGLAASIGDYIDVAGPTFVRKGTSWEFNTAFTSTPVFQAVWTSNQDVRPPKDGDWTKYTPPQVTCEANGVCTAGTFSSTARAACVPGEEGSRDQNVYTARISAGLVVSTPQNAKPLIAGTVRTFVVLAQNTTKQDMAVKLTVTAATTDVTASFTDPSTGAAVTSISAVIPPRSHVFRTVFAKLAAGSANVTASLQVRVDQQPSGASGFVTFNPPGSPTTLLAAQGVGIDANSTETFGQLLVDASLGSAGFHIEAPGTNGISTQSISNGDVGVAGFHIDGYDAAGFHIDDLDNAGFHISDLDNAGFHIDDLQNAGFHIEGLGNAGFHIDGLAAAGFHIDDLANTNLAGFHIEDVSNAGFHIENLSGEPVSDAVSSYTNTGTTTAAYDLKLVGDTGGVPVQVIVAKVYATPTTVDCRLVTRPRTVVIANVTTPDVVARSTPFSLDNTDPSRGRVTFAIAPRERIVVVLRAPVPVTRMASLVRDLQPVVVSQAAPAIALATACATACTWGDAAPVVRLGSQTSLSVTGSAYTATVAPVGMVSAQPTGFVTFVRRVATQYGFDDVPVALKPLVSGTGGQVATLVTTAPIAGEVVALYGGDARFLASSGSYVPRSPTSTTVTASASPSLQGAAVTFDVVSTPLGTPPPGLGGLILDGVPTLTIDGVAQTFDQCQSTGTVYCSKTVTGLSVGPHSVVADFAGSTSFLPSSQSVTHEVGIGAWATSAVGYPAPVADGLPTYTGEWSSVMSSACTAVTDGVRSMTVCAQSNGTDLFFVGQLTKTAYETAASAATFGGSSFMRVYFDNDGNGTRGPMEDYIAARYYDGSGYDWYLAMDGINNAADDYQDIAAGAGFEQIPIIVVRGILAGDSGTYNVEMRHPLNSGSPQDIAVSPGSSVRVRIEMDVVDPANGFARSTLRWPATGWGTIVIPAPAPVVVN